MKNSTGKGIVVASPLLLLLIFASQASAYMDVSFDVKPLSLPMNWENKTKIVICLTEDGSTCNIHLKCMWMFDPPSLTETGKSFTKRVWQPWIGKEMLVKVKTMPTNETEIYDVTHLDPRGATSATFDIFDVVKLTVSVKCSLHFWGAMCDHGCKPIEGVYECDEEGGKICTNGKMGDLCADDLPPIYRAPTAAALVDEKASDKSTSDDVVIEKQWKLTVAVGAVTLLAVGGVLVALTVVRNRRRSSGHIRGQLDTLVEA